MTSPLFLGATLAFAGLPIICYGQRPRSPSPREFFVRLAEGVDQDSPIFGAGLMATQGVVRRWIGIVPGLATVQVPEGSALDAVNFFRQWPGIRYAEPSYPLYLAEPDDAWFGEQWGLRNTGQVVNGTAGIAGADINALAGWLYGTDATPVVAVFDTGVNYLHVELKHRMWINFLEHNGTPGVDDDGNSYVDDVHGIGVDGHPGGCLPEQLFDWPCERSYALPNGDPYDLQGPCPRAKSSVDPGGHGTTVAAVVAAQCHNSQHLCGVAWNAKIMSIRIFNGCVGSYFTDFVEGVDYAVSKGAKIINASFGGNDFSQSLKDSMQAAQDAGLIIVCAAGNTYGSIDAVPFYPASFELDNIKSVAATTQSDARAPFSGWGPISVDLAAPGINIRGLAVQDYVNSNILRFWEGTSFAAPMVAGSCALLWTQHPGWTAAQVKERILCGVRPVGSMQGITVTGGVLDLERVLRPNCP